MALARKFLDKYIRKLGSIICRDIQSIRFARHYYISDLDNLEKFEAADDHVYKFTDEAGEDDRIAFNLILDEGLVKLTTE